jgi:O-antigen/teichoic acid export membrane protein
MLIRNSNLEMSLKQKTIKSFSWTLLELLFSQGTLFVVGVFLARVLTPRDFGIIGIITVFLAISNTILDSGLSRALIRKKDADEKDFSTIFFVNLGLGLFLYLLIILLSPAIAIFFEIPILKTILYYSGIVLIINALSIIQLTRITKALGFRQLALISIISSILSGTVALTMAYTGYGVWSLVALTVIKPFIQGLLLWIINQWRPRFLFSKDSFKELFDYGYKVLVANLINTIYKNIYYILIGKFFSPVSLGYYTRAEQFQAPISSNITATIGKISFPILSSLQEDQPRFKGAFIKFLTYSVYLNFTIMLCLAGMAKPIVLLMVGEKWATSIFYLQLLCVPGMLYPLQILHLNLLLVKGYSNLSLRLEIIKKLILLPMVIFTAFISINAMLYGLVLFSFVEYFINSFYTRRLIDYSYLDQFKDLRPHLFISIMTALIVLLSGWLFENLVLSLSFQILCGISAFFILNELMQLDPYQEGKKKLLELYNKFTKRGL